MVATEARKVHLESKDGAYEATGEIVSSQTISSKTRTVETITVSFKIKKSYSRFGIAALCTIDRMSLTSRTKVTVSDICAAQHVQS